MKSEKSEFDRREYKTPLDRMLHVALGRLTQGLSPVSLSLAWLDWALHLAQAPGMQAALVEKTLRKCAQLSVYAQQSLLDPDTPPTVEPLPGDHRFRAPEWRRFPFNLYAQSFLLTQQWWWWATNGVRGPSPHHKDVVWFCAKQLLDLGAPTNGLATNPVLLARTLEQGGANLVRGLQNFLDDRDRRLAGRPPAGVERFRVGHEVAATPGQVIYRNRLMELIQYSPATDAVRAEPVLFVPAWIMKYYILDLSPANSMVRYLVGRGHTVFMISWKNPDSDDHALGMDAYLRLGPMKALEAIAKICPGVRTHLVGYCLGGTLATLAAAALGRDGDERLASLTLFAAQTDFQEAGELLLFIDDGQLTLLEDLMWDQGYLDARQMTGAFQLLRSNDLLWSRLIGEYLLGERPAMSDLMAWNADSTRMPYKMHKEYLRRLFLNNELTQGHYLIDERPVAISDVRVPVFIVGASKDHIAPWRSVYKFRLQADGPVTFLLTAGGHNAGIVNPPGTPRASYQVETHVKGTPYVDPETWAERAPHREGSWWPEWQGWLAACSGPPGPLPPFGNPAAGLVSLAPAPGSYVLLK